MELILVQARENREMVAALMEGEWIGLQALVQLKTSSPMSASDLAAAVGVDVDPVASVLAQLVRFGVVDVCDGRFLGTDPGEAVLRRIESATGVRLEA